MTGNNTREYFKYTWHITIHLNPFIAVRKAALFITLSIHITFFQLYKPVHRNCISKEATIVAHNCNQLTVLRCYRHGVSFATEGCCSEDLLYPLLTLRMSRIRGKLKCSRVTRRQRIEHSTF